MFVKIVYGKVVKAGDSETTTILEQGDKIPEGYECDRYRLYEDKPILDGPNRERIMNLLLEKIGRPGAETGWERVVSFPFEQKDEVIEVFIMNDAGKTVDRYIY